MIRQAALAFIAPLMFSFIADAQEPREVFEVEIDASIEDIWNAFTTTEGLKSWVAPLADIDLKIGGKWRANYNKDGQLGDAATIENTILSYDPKRMLSLKATGFPKVSSLKMLLRKRGRFFTLHQYPRIRRKSLSLGLATLIPNSRKRCALFLIRRISTQWIN